MHFLFHAGDILETRPLAFDEAKQGDVIVFGHSDKMIVHRICRILPNALMTMGDNNASPDAWQLTRQDALFLVVARIDQRKRRYIVRRGARGMMRFYRNRTVRLFVRCAAFAGRALTRIVDWRKPLPEPEKFGDEYCYIVKNRTIAWKTGKTGVVCFHHWTDRLRYRSK